MTSRWTMALSATLFAGIATQAFGAADDCAPVSAAMMAAASLPYSETVTTADAGGKPTTSHIVQTATTKYVERNGQWTSLPISSADLMDELKEKLKTSKMTCKRGGTEAVNGQPATIYVVHDVTDGDVSDGTLWISAQNRELKGDMNVGGRHFITLFDYDHVQAPAGAKPIGRR